MYEEIFNTFKCCDHTITPRRTQKVLLIGNNNVPLEIIHKILSFLDYEELFIISPIFGIECEKLTHKKIDSVTKYVAEKGYVNLFRFLIYEKGYSLTYNIVRGIGFGGNMEIVNFLIDLTKDRNEETICRLMNSLFIGAAQAGNIHIIEWIMDNMNYQITREAWREIAFNGYKNIFELLLKRIGLCEITREDIQVWIAQSNNMDMYEWSIVLPGITASASVYYIYQAFAENGNLEMIKKFRYAWKYRDLIYSSAALYGHINIIEYGISKQHIDEKCGPPVYEMAATNNHIDIISLLKKNNVRSGSKYILAAAANGHLNIVKNALSEGCECFSNELVNKSILSGDMKMITYAMSVTGIPMVELDPIMCREIIRKQCSIELFEKVSNIPSILDDIIECAVIYFNIEFLQWIVGRNYYIGDMIYRYAIAHNDIDMLVWAINNKIPYKLSDLKFKISRYEGMVYKWRGRLYYAKSALDNKCINWILNYLRSELQLTLNI